MRLSLLSVAKDSVSNSTAVPVPISEITVSAIAFGYRIGRLEPGRSAVVDCPLLMRSNVVFRYLLPWRLALLCASG